MIYEFNSEERLSDIKLHYKQVKELKDNFSEKRSKYRKVASILKFDYISLERSFKEFEYSLLINCYTFMEQLIKNYIYQILEKGSHENIHINNFIENKINSERFSPNISYENIWKMLNVELGINLMPLISIEKSRIEKYNELVKSRHKYAHSGNYFFDFTTFEEIIELLEYLRIEIFFNITQKENYEILKSIVENYKKSIKSFNKLNSPSKEYLGKVVNDLRKDLNKAIELSLILELKKIKLLKKIPEDLEKIKNIDLRNQEKSRQVLSSLFNI